MRSSVVLGLLVVFGACGGGGGSSDGNPDAPPGDDSMMQMDAPTTPGCGYTEAADATNVNAMGAEISMITVGGTICGTINNGHFNMQTGAVDIDAYKFTLAAPADMLVHVSGSTIGTVAQRVIVQVVAITSTGSTLVNVGSVEGDHGTASVSLPAGEYGVAVVAINPQDIAAPAPYTIKLATDTPATRCAKVTAAANFTEGGDGAANNGNDMMTLDESANPARSFTANAADNPENTQLTLAAGTSYRVAGTSADVNPVDDYKDRDTFAFTTGATTTQLSVRLNWTSTTVDFDYTVHPQMNLLSVTGGFKTANTEDEFQTFAVKPNTTYWLWVAAYDGSTGAPTYDATFCAETFTP
jgi:hypothetical protein